MDQRPIGVFDSGLGGLTAVHSLWRILPEEDLIYFGDTARVPYGSRSREAILKYARQDVRFLRSFDLKAILIACGTVTTTSLAALQAENDLPMVGVVEPTCRRAVLMTQNKRVGLIATAASVRSGAYEAALRRLDPEVPIKTGPGQHILRLPLGSAFPPKSRAALKSGVPAAYAGHLPQTASAAGPHSESVSDAGPPVRQTDP